MTDLTPSLSTVLQETHSIPAIPRDSASLRGKLDSFLHDAYQINHSVRSLLTYLRAIRQPYLSTAPPPRRHQQPKHAQPTVPQSVPGFGEIPSYLDDTQREDIDSRTTILLRDINGTITNLSNALDVQHTTATKILEKKYGKPNNFLFRWAGGDMNNADDGASGKSPEQLQEEGQVKTLHAFREGVIWSLNSALKDVVSIQQGMIEIRLQRERERREVVLWDERNKNVKARQKDEDDSDGYGNMDLRGRDSYNPAVQDSATQSALAVLDPEQLQLFEEENSTLLTHYNDTLAKVTQTEKSLMEISSLQQTLVGHLNVQGEMVGQLVEDAGKTDENVRRGNKELTKASERGSLARGVFYGTVGLCSFLVVWDLIF